MTRVQYFEMFTQWYQLHLFEKQLNKNLFKLVTIKCDQKLQPQSRKFLKLVINKRPAKQKKTKIENYLNLFCSFSFIQNLRISIFVYESNTFQTLTNARS